MREWSRYPARPGDILTDVTLPEDKQTQALIQGLSQQKKLHITELRRGVVIETTSFVGRVRLGSLEITIQPKITGLPLLRLLRYAYGLRHLNQGNDADFQVAPQTFQDLLIQELAREAQALLSRGLRREYVRREEALAAPRGRIDVGRVARSGGLVTATLPCVFHERRENTLLNQVLRAGLNLGARATADPLLRTRLRRLGSFLEDAVSSTRLDGQVLTRAHRALSRLTAAYAPALTLITLLWENQGLSLEDGTPQVELPGFLFDMNKFFQALLSRFLAENLPGYRLEDEHRLQGVFSYSPAFNPRSQRAPTPRPDYALWRGTKLVAILDAKYRDLWATSLPPEWLYQLAIYAMSQPAARTAAILYPIVGVPAQEARIDIRNPVSGQGNAQVILRPLDLGLLDQAIAAGNTANAQRGRLEMARQMAFGDGLDK